MICQELKLDSIKNTRLVSKTCCEIATPFLMDQVHLIFKLDSFERLLAISRHPIISQHITSIYYEPDSPRKYADKEEWSQCLHRKPIAYEFDFTQEPKDTYTQQELDAGYGHYRHFL